MYDTELETRLADALTALAENCDNTTDVADKLMGLGIKGNHSSYTCPVANYLRKILDLTETQFVSVGAFTASMGERERDEITTQFSLRLPDVVMRFVYVFDAAQYSGDPNSVKWYLSIHEA